MCFLKDKFEKLKSGNRLVYINNYSQNSHIDNGKVGLQ